MREIKFRAWDKEQNCMLSSKATGLIIHFDGTVNAYDSEATLIGTEFINELEVMQYTGLKDKHGKEIYEGDVVKYTLKSYYNKTVTEMIPVTWGSYSDGGEYVDNVECWMIRYKSLSDICDNKYNQSVEVIGNIYENPELLEG